MEFQLNQTCICIFSQFECKYSEYPATTADNGQWNSIPASVSQKTILFKFWVFWMFNLGFVCFLVRLSVNCATPWIANDCCTIQILRVSFQTLRAKISQIFTFQSCQFHFIFLWTDRLHEKRIANQFVLQSHGSLKRTACKHAQPSQVSNIAILVLTHFASERKEHITVDSIIISQNRLHSHFTRSTPFSIQLVVSRFIAAVKMLLLCKERNDTNIKRNKITVRSVCTQRTQKEREREREWDIQKCQCRKTCHRSGNKMNKRRPKVTLATTNTTAKIIKCSKRLTAMRMEVEKERRMKKKK